MQPRLPQGNNCVSCWLEFGPVFYTMCDRTSLTCYQSMWHCYHPPPALFETENSNKKYKKKTLRHWIRKLKWVSQVFFTDGNWFCHMSYESEAFLLWHCCVKRPYFQMRALTRAGTMCAKLMSWNTNTTHRFQYQSNLNIIACLDSDVILISYPTYTHPSTLQVRNSPVCVRSMNVPSSDRHFNKKNCGNGNENRTQKRVICSCHGV